MCKICEENKKHGITNYLCIEKIKEHAKKTKPTKITDIPIRTKLIPVYFDKEQVNFVKNRNCFAKWLYKKTGKVLRPLCGIPKR